MPNDVDDFQSLRDAPTSKLWRIELEHLLSGEREPDMTHLADAGEYVRKVLELSHAPALSRAELSDALERLVGEWNPAASQEPERLWCLLDLLRTFPVAGGSAKLLRLFDNREALAAQVLAHEGVDLRRRALEVLAVYFPAPSAENGAALDRYAELLEAHLELPGHAAYACKALLRLNRLELNHGNIEAFLRKDERLISSIVDWAFETSAEPRAMELLTMTYSACLRFEVYQGAPSARLFRKAVYRAGGVFSFEGARLAFPRSPTVPREMGLDEQVLYFHWNSEMNESNAHAIATIARQSQDPP